MKHFFSKTIVSEDPVPDKMLGSYGRLEIPDLSISVPLYSAEGKDAQKIVDATNSAAIFGLGKQTVIADHVHQSNFQNLIRVQPGKTKAFIHTTDRITRYVCILSFVRTTDGKKQSYICILSQLGHIQKSEVGNRLYDWEGTPARDKNENGLTIYTCLGPSVDDIQKVTITYWKKV